MTNSTGRTSGRRRCCGASGLALIATLSLFAHTGRADTVTFTFDIVGRPFSGQFDVDDSTFVVVSHQYLDSPTVTAAMKQTMFSGARYLTRCAMNGTSVFNYSVGMPLPDTPLFSPTHIDTLHGQLAQGITVDMTTGSGYSVMPSDIYQAVTLWWLHTDSAAIEGALQTATWTLAGHEYPCWTVTTLGWPGPTAPTAVTTTVRMSLFPYSIIDSVYQGDTASVVQLQVFSADPPVSASIAYNRITQSVESYDVVDSLLSISPAMKADYATCWWGGLVDYEGFPATTVNNHPHLFNGLSSELQSLQGQPPGFSLKDELMITGPGFAVEGSTVLRSIVLAWLETDNTAFDGQEVPVSLLRNGVPCSTFYTTTVIGFKGWSANDEQSDVVQRWLAIPYSVVRPCAITLTGDVNVSGTITSADIITLVSFVFKGGNPPQPCLASGDVNCSGTVTSADIIALVNFVFKGGVGPCDACTSSLASGC